MSDNNNILSCFVKIGFDPRLTEQDFIDLDRSFSPYVWGEFGIDETLKKLKHDKYGKDLIKVLFQFYVKPTKTELQKIKDIESYRAKEKAIGIPVIINNENFFNKSDKDRYIFLKQIIFIKLELLAEVIKKKKLDTKIDILTKDLEKLLIQ